MKKRIFAFFFAAALLFSAVSVNAFAADADVAFSNPTGKAGEEVILSVSLSQNSGIAALRLQLSYDSAVLTPKSVTYNAEMLKGAQFMDVTAPQDNGKVILNWLCYQKDHNVTASGEYAAVVFAIKDNAPAGDSMISVSYNSADNYRLDGINMVDVSISVAECKVTVLDAATPPTTDTPSTEEPDTEPVVTTAEVTESVTTAPITEPTVTTEKSPETDLPVTALPVTEESAAPVVTDGTSAPIDTLPQDTTSAASGDYSIYAVIVAGVCVVCIIVILIIKRRSGE